MLAAIDVGTNTVRLLLGEAGDGVPVPVAYHRQITRLGGGFTLEKGLAPDAMERTLSALMSFASLARDAGATQIRAVGTEALRKAKNAGQFVTRVQQAAGLLVEIIDGGEEAELSAAGVLTALAPCPGAALIFDIGGGSTEFVLLEAGLVRFRQSFELGVVSLAESLPDPAAQQRLIHSTLNALDASLAAGGTPLPAECALVGTAGTVTTLAAIDLQMVDYDWRRVNNHGISLRRLEELLGLLEGLPLDLRETLPGMEKGRGDLIVPGGRIVLEVMRYFGQQVLTVSDFGLLEGVLLSLARRGQ